MQVPFVHGPGELKLNEVASPEPGPRDVVIRVAATGICGSDLGYIKRGGVAGPTSYPIPLGHELCGTVAEIGNEVRSVSVGDRVIVNPIFSLIGNGGPEGGFAQRLRVRDVAGQPRALLRMPDDMSFENGALVEPLAVAAHAINRMDPSPGAKVAIFGAGPIGLGAVVALRHRGIDDIAVFDLSAFRRERALQLGARAACDPRDRHIANVLSELHDTIYCWGATLPGTTHYLEASGAPSIIPLVVDIAAPSTRITVVSVQQEPVTLDFQHLLAREISIVMAMGYPTEFEQVLDMIRSGGRDLSPMISHIFPASDVMAAFAMAERRDQAAKVLVDYR